MNEFYIYTIDRISLPSSSSLTKSIRIGAEKFNVMYINGYATNGDNLKLNIKITNRGKVLMNNNVLFSSIVGTAQRPFILPAPLKLDENSDIEITFTDLSGSNQTIDLALIGLKI